VPGSYSWMPYAPQGVKGLDDDDDDDDDDDGGGGNMYICANNTAISTCI